MEIKKHICGKSFQLKDMFPVIQDKETRVRIFDYQNEIDYNMTANYTDYFVHDIGLGQEDGEPCIMIYLDKGFEINYIS